MQQAMRIVTIGIAPAMLAASMVSRAQYTPDTHHEITPAVAIQGVADAAARVGQPPLSSTPTLQYSHGDPTADEQYTLEMINRARANPAAEGGRLATTTDPAITGNYTYYQIDTAALRRDFATYTARPPLAFNAKLLASARRHTNDMAANNFQSHKGSDNSLFDKRIKDAGYNGFTWIGENIFAYAQNLWHGLAGFLVDWGNPELGHRHNLLNFGATDSLATEIGIAIKIIPLPQPGNVGPYVITHNLGNVGKRLVTGVVYNDLNGNNFYDQGEGIPNITIMPSAGTYYAITSASGGYAIPMTGVSGTVTIVASGAGLPTPISKELEIAGPNIKLDFNPGGTTTTTAQVNPPNGAIVRPPQLRLIWTRGGGSTDRYRWMLATDPQMNNIIRGDTSTADTSTTVPGLFEGETYYWQVAAHNANGWGVWSPVWSFRLLEVPATVNLAGPMNGASLPAGSVRFWWRRGGGTTAEYRFELATDTAMTSIIRSDSALPDTSLMVTGLNPGAYFWRVSAGNDAGWSPYSEVWSVRLGTSSAPPILSDAVAVSLTAEPNPARDVVTFRLRIARPGHVRINLHGRDGAVVVALADERLPAGETSVGWKISDVPSGLYLYQVTVDGMQVGAGTVVVVH